MTQVIFAAGRRQRKKVAARARIVDSAIKLFAGRDIDAVTVDEIAEAADVGKGTIYNHFRAKEDIVVAFMADLERRVQATLNDFKTSTRPAAEVLTEFVRSQARMKEPHHAFVRVFLGQMFLHTARFLPYMAEIHQIMNPPVEELLGALQQRGAIRDDVSVPELAFVLTNIQLGFTALWAIEGPPFLASYQLLEREMRLFCEGLETR